METSKNYSNLSIQKINIREFVDLAKNPGFAFARISDGGFFCLQGRKGYNCDGVAYTKEQADSLFSMLKDDSIYHGITSIAIHVARASEWLHEHNLADIYWYDADVMNKASDEGELWPFIEFLYGRKTILCGPDHLRLFNGFPIEKFIECHSSEAFEEVNELEMEIQYSVKKYNADTVLLSAGQGASPSLVSRLHTLFSKIVIIDCGSIWSPYVRTFIRSGHKKRGWDEYVRLGKLNFHCNIREW